MEVDMALHIAPSTSVEVATGDAFADNGTLVPDFILFVDANAYLISDSGSGNGAKLTGSWTVTVNGAVEGLGDDGIFFSQASTLTVGKNGDVFGSVEGIVAPGGLTLTNFGTIGCDLGNDAIFTNGELHIKNAGTIAGSVDSNGATNDSFTDFIKVAKHIKNGHVTGVVDLGVGDDHFNGGANAESVIDGAGADVYKLGGGNDTYLAAGGPGDATDTIDAGKGIDTYDATDALADVEIHLGGSKSAQGNDISGGFVDKDAIAGFENAFGGAGMDSIFGDGGANVLKGNGNDDTLSGLGGNDQLFGGDGADELLGLKGADILTGGNDADKFTFDNLSDSTVAKSGRDTITDFETGVDKINLGFSGGLTYIGRQNFHHSAGEVRESFTDGGNSVVSVDVNGDGKADFAITLIGHILLQAGDFPGVAV
jgi:Ca2+-binding RTX toxin-like protein